MRVTRVSYDLERQSAVVTLPLGGPFAMVYRSDRVPGYTTSLTARVSLVREDVPERLRTVKVTTSLDGHERITEYEPAPLLMHQVSADQPSRVGVRAEFVFDEGTAPMHATVPLGTPDPRTLGLGGFVLRGLPTVDGSRLLLASGRTIYLRHHDAGSLIAVDRGLAYIVRDDSFVRAVDAVTGRTVWEMERREDHESFIGPGGARMQISRDADRVTLATDERTTELEVDDWVTRLRSDSGEVALGVDASGLLTALMDGPNVHCSYDSGGRLSDLHIGDRHIVFRRDGLEDGFRVTASDGGNLDERIEVRSTGDGLVRARQCCGFPPVKTTTSGPTTITERADGSVVRHTREGAETRTTVTLPSGAERSWRRFIRRDGDMVESGLEHKGEVWLTRMDVVSGAVERHSPAGRVARSHYEDEYQTLSASLDGTWQAFEWDGEIAMASHGTLGEFSVTFERDGRSAIESAAGVTETLRHDDGYDVVLPSGIAIADRPIDDGRLVAVGGQAYVSVDTTEQAVEIRHDGRVLVAQRAAGPAQGVSVVSEGELTIADTRDGVADMHGPDVTRRLVRTNGRIETAGSGDDTITYRWDGSELLGLSVSGRVAGDVSLARSSAGAIDELEIAGSAFAVELTDGAMTRLGPLTIELDEAAIRPHRIAVGRIVEEWAYDDEGRLAERRVLLDGNQVFAHTVERDAAARIVRQWYDGPTEHEVTYRYEGGHLVEVSADQSESFVYDDRGRLTGLSDVAVQVSAAGSPLAVDDDHVEMTDAGRIRRVTVDGTEVTLGYNAAGELVSIATAAGTTQITRDAFGRALEIDDGTEIRRFLWDDTGPVALIDATGGVVERYVRPPGRRVPELVVRGDAVLRLITDQVGSPLALIHSEVGTVEQFIWSAYGELLSGPADFTFGFGGSVVLNARPLIVDLGVRSYIPGIGRWAQWDPLLHGGGGTDLYGYAANDPVNRYDPTGTKVKYCISKRNLHGFLQTDKGEFGQDFGSGPPPWFPKRDLFRFFGGGARFWRIFTRWGPQYKNDDPKQGPRSAEEGTQCFSLPPWLEVDEECVNELTKPGTYAGTYLLPKPAYGFNVCHTVALEVLNECRISDVDKFEQFLDELAAQLAADENCCGVDGAPEPPLGDGFLGARGGGAGVQPEDGLSDGAKDDSFGFPSPPF